MAAEAMTVTSSAFTCREDIVSGTSHSPSNGCTQLCFRASEADCRFAGSQASIFMRKLDTSEASSFENWYFSLRTSSSGHSFRFLMCFNLPLFKKKSLEYFPDNAYSFGGRPPSNSAMSAKWSSSRSQSSPVLGSNRKSPVASSKNMHAALHTSAVSSHFAPMMTSGDLYWRVWISSVTGLLTLMPLPKSASLAKICSGFMVSKRSRCLTGGIGLPHAAAATWSPSSGVPFPFVADTADGFSSSASEFVLASLFCAILFFFFWRFF
mmetsp:Transcript_58362/g.103758  ORF Transcript_58362/g.103758 Transcript_58362/m.103758 type:complete len:266 (-) Transcript_58362:821-1618(-)